jgi:hypothetical protein
MSACDKKGKHWQNTHFIYFNLKQHLLAVGRAAPTLGLQDWPSQVSTKSTAHNHMPQHSSTAQSRPADTQAKNTMASKPGENKDT